MCPPVSWEGLEDGVASEDDDDGFIQVDLVEKSKVLVGGGQMKQAKELSESGGFVDTPERGGLVVVIGGPSTTPCWRAEFTGCRVRANNDVRVSCLE